MNGSPIYSKIFLGVFVAFSLLLAANSYAAYGDTATWLSRPYAGDGGDPKAAYLDFAEDAAFDRSGAMYIADTYNNVIRKVEDGVISTFAGTGSYGDADGAVSKAKFGLPKGVAVDSSGCVYVADTDNGKIKKICSGKVKTILNKLKNPEGVAVFGNTLYVSDTGHNLIKKISTNGSSSSVVASGVLSPKKLISDKNGENLYVAEGGRYRVIKINIASGDISLVAGSGSPGYQEGVGSNAKFRNIVGVALDQNDADLFVTDGNGYTDYVRRIDLSTNETFLHARDAVMASINYPKGIAHFGDYVYVASSGIGTIHRFPTTIVAAEDSKGKQYAIAELVVGKERFGNTDGLKKKAILGRPYDMVFSPDKKYIYLAENNKLRKINYVTGKVEWLIGHSVDNYVEGDRLAARFSTIASLTIDHKGKNLYLADRWNNRIRRVNLDKLNASLVSGTGRANAVGPGNGYREGTKNTALFDNPASIAISYDDKYLFVADTSNNRIRRVRISDGETKLLAGSRPGYKDGRGGSVQFNAPFGISLDENNNLYIADRNNHAIRKLNLKTNQVETVAGCGKAGYLEGIGKSACFSYPEYLKVGEDGNVYISEVGGQRIRVYDPKTKSVKLVAGSGMRGYKNGTSKVSEFNNPKGLLPNTKANRLLVADTWNDVLRLIDIKGKAPYTQPAPVVYGVGPKNKYTPATYDSQQISLYIGGKNFRHRAKAYFGNQEALKTYVNSDKKLSLRLLFGKMSPGYYDVAVLNVDGQSGVLKSGFVVLNADGSLPSKRYKFTKGKSANVISEENLDFYKFLY